MIDVSCGVRRRTLPVEFDTVTLTAADVATFPDVSRATAVSEWLPFDAPVESHESEYGGLVSSTPMFVPSSLNCTPATPPLSDAHADKVTEPDSVAPDAGDEMNTMGGVVSDSAGAPGILTCVGGQGGAAEILRDVTAAVSAAARSDEIAIVTDDHVRGQRTR